MRTVFILYFLLSGMNIEHTVAGIQYSCDPHTVTDLLEIDERPFRAGKIESTEAQGEESPSRSVCLVEWHWEATEMHIRKVPA